MRRGGKVNRVRTPFRQGSVALAIGALGLACWATGASAGAVPSTRSHKSAKNGCAIGTTTAKVLRCSRDGLPNLKGVTIKIVNGASDAVPGDAHVFSMVQYLKKWGANAQLTLAHGAEPDLAVASGSEDANTAALGPAADAGLTVFGPNQTAVDYLLFADKNIKNAQGLVGKTFAVTNTSAPDYALLLAYLAQNNLKLSQVHLLVTGSDKATFDALVAGTANAIFGHSSDLTTVGSKYNVLKPGAKVIPGFADSFMYARGSWLRANPAYAEAIDLGWLAAARQFDRNRPGWIEAARAYTYGTVSGHHLSQDYAALKSIDGWPLSKGALTLREVALNVKITKTEGGLQGAGLRSAAQLTNLKPWHAAWSLYSAEPSRF